MERPSKYKYKKNIPPKKLLLYLQSWQPKLAVYIAYFALKMLKNTVCDLHIKVLRITTAYVKKIVWSLLGLQRELCEVW